MRPNAARPFALIQFALRCVGQAFGDLRTNSAVDLFALAQSRRVLLVEFRPLLAEGSLFIKEDGFTVQINSKEAEVIRLNGEPVTRKLTAKQRFTFAHEIAHTLPYDTTVAPPRIKPEVLKTIEDSGGRGLKDSLESFCQIAAGFILVPQRGLRHDDVLGPWGKVDSLDLIRRMARRFEVSPEVMIHRVANAGDEEALKDPDFSLVMVTKIGRWEQVRACIYSATLTGLFKQPRLYTRVATWVQATPILKRCNLLGVEEGKWTTPTTTGTLRITKKRYPRNPASYFLELKHTPESA